MSRPAKFSITRRQAECFTAIKDHLAATGLVPSRRELQQRLNLRSPGHVVQLLRALEERGWIKVLPNKVRAISIIAADDVPAGYHLLPAVEAALRAYCAAHKEADPGAVVNDAVALFLDEAEGSIAA